MRNYGKSLDKMWNSLSNFMPIHSGTKKAQLREKNKHVVKTGVTLMYQANLPQNLWVDAFLTAKHLINAIYSIEEKEPIFPIVQ